MARWPLASLWTIAAPPDVTSVQPRFQYLFLASCALSSGHWHKDAYAAMPHLRGVIGPSRR